MKFYLTLYSLGVNVYLLGYVLFGMQIPVIAQSIHIAHWVLLSAWLVLPLQLRFLPKGFFALLPPMLVFLLWYGGHFLPLDPPADISPLTVATFNLQGNTDGELVALSPLLQAFQADIIGLQEVDYADRVKLAREWSEEYPYQAFAMQSQFDMIGIVSRYPILESTYPQSRDFLRPTRDSPRYLRTLIDYQGQKIAVYVFHPMRPEFLFFLTYDDELNRLNIQQLLEAIAAESYPTVVLCDCNTSPLTPQYRVLAGQLGDLQAERGWGLGLTHTGLPWLPFRNTRIDYIWFSAEFSPLRVRVWGENGGSDHFPLWGQLGL